MMKFADRVLETSTTQGTGTLNLVGPTTGFQGFLDGVVTGSKVPYIIDDGTDWEVGIGTVTSGTPDTLARTTVLASTNANAAVNWGPGTRNVRLAPVANIVVQRDENLNLIEGFATSGGTGDVVTLTLSPAPLAYSDGQEIAFFMPGANTTTVTVNVNSLGAKALKWNGAALSAGALPSAWPVHARYSSALGWFEMYNSPAMPQVTIASAGTTDLGAASSRNVLISGTTTITAFGSSASTGNPLYNIEFSGALTLTHNGTSLILPGSANITTAAGDTGVAEYLGSGNWRVRSYQKASGQAVVAPTDNFSSKLLHIQDQKAAGTAGGTFTSGAWQTRTLNTEVTDEIGSTLASNQFTLPAGTYYIDAEAPALAVGIHKAKLYNITDTADVILGSSSSAQNSSTGFSFSNVRGRFTIASEKTFELQHRCQTTQATNGLGAALSFSVIEVFADVRIWKVA